MATGPAPFELHMQEMLKLPRDHRRSELVDQWVRCTTNRREESLSTVACWRAYHCNVVWAKCMASGNTEGVCQSAVERHTESLRQMVFRESMTEGTDGDW